MSKKEREKGSNRSRNWIPSLIVEGIAKKTGYSRKHIRDVIKGRKRNYIIEYLWKLSQEDAEKFLKETGLLK